MANQHLNAHSSVATDEHLKATCYEEVLPADMRMVGDIFAQKLMDGRPPHTALECWFRRVVRSLVERDRYQYEAWLVLTAMAYSIERIGDPLIFATYVPMPCGPEEFKYLVKLAFSKRPESTNRDAA